MVFFYYCCKGNKMESIKTTAISLPLITISLSITEGCKIRVTVAREKMLVQSLETAFTHFLIHFFLWSYVPFSHTTNGFPRYSWRWWCWFLNLKQLIPEPLCLAPIRLKTLEFPCYLRFFVTFRVFE